MIRVLIWAERLWPGVGGIEQMALLLSSSLRERGYDVEMVTWQWAHEAREEIVNGIPYHRLPMMSTEETPARMEIFSAGLSRMRRLMTQFQPDIMLLMQPTSLLMFYDLALRIHPSIVIFGLHDRWEELWMPDHLVGQVIRASDYVLSCSEVVLESARLLIPEIGPRSMTIRNALPVQGIEPTPLPWDEPRFLCIGRLVPQKCFETAIAAFARIAAQYPKARLIISGDGPERDRLGALADELGISGRVDFTGWVLPKDVYAAMNQATVLVVPSLHEGLPLVAIQAAQMARPILASDVDGLREVMVDGETGLLCQPRDDSALAAAMAYLLDHHDAAIAMGQAGRQVINDRFDWETYVQLHDELFRRLLATRELSESSTP